MNSTALNTKNRRRSGRGGSVLIIVLWVALGLVSIALYFGNAMSLEMRASDNRYANLEAQQAVAGAERYVVFILSNLTQHGTIPDPLTFASEGVPIGNATFWMIGRATNGVTSTDLPAFGLVDEASKLNLNTATIEMLQALPRMTPQLAAAIIDWRDSDQQATENGAESETYLARNPGYRAKDGKFESVEELRLVLGADLDVLYGEDWNRNGVLDVNENDGDTSPPGDNRDGHLDPGLVEFVTVFSRESNLRADGSGSNRVNVASNNVSERQIRNALSAKLGDDRARQIAQRVAGAGTQRVRSLLEFYVRGQMTPDEFALVEGDLTVSDQPIEGLININTASQAVLACIPGIGPDKAPNVAAFRQQNPDKLKTVAWLAEAVDQASALQAGPYVTVHSYQFTADIAATGHNGRGYQRVLFVIDTSGGAPEIKYREELSHLGWALGPTTRRLLLTQIARNTLR